MATPTPRTRRQLREALERSESDREAAESRVSSHEVRVEQQRDRIEQLEWDKQRAETTLRKAGFTSSPGPASVGTHGPLLTTYWTAPKDASSTDAERWAAELRTAADLARRNTIAALLNALEIKGYERHGYPKVTKRGDIEQVTLGHDTDRFWADIQTALEVRAEKKAADEREATEKKVAGLAPAQQLSFYYPRIGFDPAAGGAAVFASIFDDGRIRIDDIKGTTPEPVPKKPAKKKSEGKK
ncbi:MULTISPECIES: hypothetical protein [unclassified Microbacterium]|uniref:hypothetical protein n=1 Tax=unclassified Microbacterium TaxID=2609290 RepID=UPI000EA940A9|nr:MULTISPECIES: hypothetical protein [unclassified Microbacterium]MBT2484780.1 hypothetical protein [Microbacterium sp. ISL-108]RKN67656.1 hypothetical protein D7252_08710 [Microbacterium sp. CGR2]